jgi:hypothetical protein
MRFLQPTGMNGWAREDEDQQFLLQILSNLWGIFERFRKCVRMIQRWDECYKFSAIEPTAWHNSPQSAGSVWSGLVKFVFGIPENRGFNPHVVLNLDQRLLRVIHYENLIEFD